MISKLYNFWQILRENLWFTPALFCIAYFFATLGLYIMEREYFSDAILPQLFFSGSNDDAKSVILALQSSMITMATLAISITMVVLSLAATQLGPRLIRSFMGDRKTQNYIGLFFGSIVACFLLSSILHDKNPEQWVPKVTLNFILTSQPTSTHIETF